MKSNEKKTNTIDKQYDEETSTENALNNYNISVLMLSCRRIIDQ